MCPRPVLPEHDRTGADVVDLLILRYDEDAGHAVGHSTGRDAVEKLYTRVDVASAPIICEAEHMAIADGVHEMLPSVGA